MALLDNSMQINTIMPSFVKTHSLEVGPLSDLVGRWVACVGLGECTYPSFRLCGLNGFKWMESRAMMKIR